MEQYVEKAEFEALKKEVEEIKAEQNKNTDLLHELDKKLDVIIEKIGNSEKNEEIKIKPINTRVDSLEERIKKIEATLTWLWRLIGATVIGVIFDIIFSIKK